MSSAFFRETAIGQLVHLLSKGSLLRYPEEQPDFVLPESILHPARTIKPTEASTPDHQTLVDPESQDASGSKGMQEKSKVPQEEIDGPIIVGWYSDTDPDNPQNWSAFHKGVTTFCICALTFGVYVGSSLITSGFPSLMRDFGIVEEEATVTLSIYVLAYGLGALLFSPLSEIAALGRNPFYYAPMVAFTAFQAGAATVPTFTGLVLLRFLTAFCGSPVLSTGGATLGDMYTPVQLPTVLSIWILPAFAAPAVSPVFGSFAAQAKGWRWTMWELLWIVGFVTTLLLVALPETSHGNILLRRAERLRKLTGNTNIKAQSEIEGHGKSATDLFNEAILRPFRITFLDPSIGFTNAYTSVVYAIYYMFFDAFPITYGEIFKFSFGAQGIAYLTIAIGGAVGCALYVGYQQLYMIPWYGRNGWPVNEKRLEPAILAAIFAPIGLFIFAWTSRPSVHWIGSLIGSGLFVGANFVTLQSVFFYIALSYPQYAASIFASNEFMRAMTATAFLHAGTPMFRAMGVDGGVSFLAGLTVFGVPGIYSIYRYGARLRARSRFAVGDA